MEAEAEATVAHAVHKEHEYLLSDYYVTREWFNRRAPNLTKELKTEEAAGTALRLNEQIEEGLIEAPVKLIPARLIGILVKKFVEDSISERQQ
ncbi:MAG: hypothetical protein QXM42_04910 [Zestosphaera sp.]